MPKLKKTEVIMLIEKLENLYPDAECALEHRNVFELLIATVLSAQTTDKSVNLVTPGLFEKANDAKAISELPQDELEDILRKIGMYRSKAKNIKALSKMLVETHRGEVPGDYDELIKLPGVGRKTANVVLSVGFGEQRIAVDTHVFRLANRIGLCEEKDVLRTELALMEGIPKEHWTRMHHALIFHGRQVCMARNPKCEFCGIAELCKMNGLSQEKRQL